MKSFNAMLSIFKIAPKPQQDADNSLSFDGLNPLLAKQLSELESQIGQLAQVQFELGLERQRMRIEMEALKKAVSQPEVINTPAIAELATPADSSAAPNANIQ